MAKAYEQTLLKIIYTCSQQTNEKNAHDHKPLEKCKSKPHWDTISHQSEWSLLKNQKATRAAEVGKKREHLYAAGEI